MHRGDMRKLAAILLAIAQFALLTGTASAQLMQDHPAGKTAPDGSARVAVRESWIEEWDPTLGRWVRVSEPVVRTVFRKSDTALKAAVARPELAARRHGPRFAKGSVSRTARQYGPFRVIDERRAALIGSTDAASPGLFAAMLRDHPQLEVLELVEAPGTSNDIANLVLGRRIRAAGLNTHVPAGGSVRSGAVELFLAGKGRTIDPGAKFAVHSWLDERGREAGDLAPDAPAHLMYIGYYMEMGLSEKRARAFYAMTNSVPHASALWLRADDMRQWIEPERASQALDAQRIAAPAPAPIFAQNALLPPSIVLPSIELARIGESETGRTALPTIAYADIAAVSFARGGLWLRAN